MNQVQNKVDYTHKLKITCILIAQEAGEIAALRGRPCTENPYRRESSLNDWWFIGWQSVLPSEKGLKYDAINASIS